MLQSVLIEFCPFCSLLGGRFCSLLGGDRRNRRVSEIHIRVAFDLQYSFRLGFPVFVILDHEGAYIHTQSAGRLECDPIFTATDPDPDKVVQFLAYWKAGGANDEAAADV